ncbi:hypothetical protein AMK09_22700 [Streptomyces sp. CB02488]|nr:hypothetical protein AMK09_22700 [Streptomyces sp. CB02488]
MYSPFSRTGRPSLSYSTISSPSAPRSPAPRSPCPAPRYPAAPDDVLVEIVDEVHLPLVRQRTPAAPD